MPKIYPVTAWKNTGFNNGNVPGTLAAFENCPSLEFNAVFLRQTRTHASIRIESTWENVQDIDYIRIGNESNPAYYIVDGVNMLSDVTAELRLTLDPLMTAGGTGAIFVNGGTLERCHRPEGLFENDVPEPFGLSRPRVIRSQLVYNANDLNEKKIHVILAVCDLSKTDEVKAAYAEASTETGEKVIAAWPETIPAPTTATFAVYDKGNISAAQQLPGYSAFDGDADEIKKGINAARSLGWNVIVNSYEIPTKLVSATPGANHAFPILIGATPDITPEMPYKFATVKNPKALSINHTYKIVSITSNDSKEFNANELFRPDATAPTWKMLVDPSPNGTCYLRPAFYAGRETEYNVYAIAGLPWPSSAIIYSEASGSSMTMANARRAAATAELTETYRNVMDTHKEERLNADFIDINTGLLKNMGGAALKSILGDFAGAAGGVAGSALDYASQMNRHMISVEEQIDTENYGAALYQREMGDRIFNAYSNAYMASPEVAFPVSPSIASMLGNAFLIVQMTPADEDIKRLDRLLTMYGTAQANLPFTTAYLNNRTKFNYIKSGEAHITAPGVPASITKQIEAMFNNGVRIWHVPYNVSAYDDNPEVN